MRVEIQRQSVTRRCRSAILVAATLMLPPNCGIATAQGLTGALIGTVTDERDGGTRRCARHDHVAGADWRSRDAAHQRQGATAIPVLASGYLHVRDRTRGIHPLLRSGYAHRGRRHYRETDRSDSSGRCGIGLGRGDWLTHRPTKPRVRNAFRFRGHRRDSDATNQHARLPQGRPRRVADIAVKRYGDDHFRLRLRHQRKPVSHRWHEHDLSVQWRRANGARCRFHSRSTGRRGRSVGRVRQHAGRRDQRRHQARRRAVVRCVVLRTGVRSHQHTSHARLSRLGRTAKRLWTREVRGFHQQRRRSGHSRTAVVLRRISVAARLRQPAGHRSDAPAPERRRSSSRSSRGG